MTVTGITAHAASKEMSDCQLLLCVHNGDERAFEELFMRHYSWLLANVLRVTGDSAEAEEIVQDTFLRLYERPIPGEDGDNVRGWLYRVAVNMAFNAVRSRNRRTGWLRRLAHRADAHDTYDDPLTLVTEMDDAARVRKNLAALPDRQRNVLLLRATGHSYSEIAEIVDVKLGSVGTILARAERALRKEHERENGRHGDQT